MARKPRVFVEGGTYHIYNRISSGEAVFADPEWALELVGMLRMVTSVPIRARSVVP